MPVALTAHWFLFLHPNMQQMTRMCGVYVCVWQGHAAYCVLTAAWV